MRRLTGALVLVALSWASEDNKDSLSRRVLAYLCAGLWRDLGGGLLYVCRYLAFGVHEYHEEQRYRQLITLDHTLRPATEDLIEEVVQHMVALMTADAMYWVQETGRNVDAEAEAIRDALERESAVQLAQLETEISALRKEQERREAQLSGGHLETPCLPVWFICFHLSTQVPKTGLKPWH